MSGTTASVSASVEIYPFEGGPYILRDAQIISLSITKALMGNSDGSFSIVLAPGGPNGTEDPVPWSRVITPMSHVLIGMTRGNASQIVMDGVVTEASEQQLWTTQDKGSTAQRVQVITGSDISWFFNTFSYWALTFLGLTAGAPVGDNTLPQNFAQIISQGLTSTSQQTANQPSQVGRLWFREIMGGPQGVLNATYFPYAPTGTKIKFSSAVSATWEAYPNVVVPLQANWMMGGTQSWWSKLKQFMSEPWYELFTITAPQNFFAPANLASGGFNDQGYYYSMASQPNAAAAGPQLIARVNPLPKLSTNIASNGTVSIGSLDVSRWNKLPMFDFTQANFGFLKSRINFDCQAAYNFYQINPTSYGFLGISTVNNLPSQFLYICGADAASIERYGFKPSIASTTWFFDPTGQATQSSGPQIQNTVIALTGAYVGWAHPIPLMARAEVQIPLNPIIQIGCRFRYAPFKDGEPWDFYIEGYRHEFVFGGPSVTQVTLARGLPSSIYSDASTGGVLQAIVTGNAMRQNGVYVKGLPPGVSGTPTGLTFIQTANQVADLATNLTVTYVKPQPTTQPPAPPA